jgi:pimeloyl-ACP methyl ester carboxylesterase
MQFALPDGYNLNVEEVGSGFPLIVLHGGPGLDHSMFRPYLDALGDEYRLLYIDERGQGRSQRVDPATLSLEVFASDVDCSPRLSSSNASPCSATPLERSSRPTTRPSSALRPPM